MQPYGFAFVPLAYFLARLVFFEEMSEAVLFHQCAQTGKVLLGKPLSKFLRRNIFLFHRSDFQLCLVVRVRHDGS